VGKEAGPARRSDNCWAAFSQPEYQDPYPSSCKYGNHRAEKQRQQERQQHLGVAQLWAEPAGNDLKWIRNT
jgi:hypothetical protein